MPVHRLLVSVRLNKAMFFFLSIFLLSHECSFNSVLKGLVLYPFSGQVPANRIASLSIWKTSALIFHLPRLL